MPTGKFEPRGTQLLMADGTGEIGPEKFVPQTDATLFLVQFVMTGSDAVARLEGSFNREDWAPLWPLLRSSSGLIPAVVESDISQSGIYYYPKVPSYIRAVSLSGEVTCYA